MKVEIRSQFLGREVGRPYSARKRRGLVVASNDNATQFKIAVEGLPMPVWIDSKDVHFI